MKKGLAVFSGSAVVHKLMQDGTVVLGTAANPAAVTISGSLTASADSIEVSNVRGNFTATTLGGILVELKSKASADSGSLKSYIDAQDSAEAAARVAGDAAVQANLDSVSGSIKGYVDGLDAAQTAANAALSGAFNTRVESLETTVQAVIGDNTLLSDITGTLNSIKEIAEYLDGDGTPAQLVADLSTEVSRIIGALVQEVADRTAAVSAEESRALAAEAVISGNLAQELVDRAAAIASLSSSVSSSFDAEITARIAGDAAVQTNLDSVSGSLKAAIDAIQSGASGDTSALSSSFSASLAAEVARATAAEGLVQSNLDSVSGSLKGYVDGLDAAQTAANGALSSSFETALAAEVSRATTAEALVQSNLDSVSGSLAAAVAAEKTRAEGAEAGLQSAIDTEKGRIDAILSGSDVDLDTFKQVVDFVNSIDLTNDNALLAAITDINGDISALSGNLASEISRATAAEATISGNLATEKARAEGAEAGLQAQIDSASFSVNGMSVDPFGGSFTIVSSSNIAVGSAAGVVTVSLKDQVSITGSLSAAQLSASAGLSVVGGASVAGGMTVSSGDMSVSQGAVSVKMTRVQAAARTAQDGDMFYLTDTSDDPASAFPRGKAWYFRQDGEWFDAPFYGEG